MALIPCQECNKQISDRAGACPSCGCPVESPSQLKLRVEADLRHIESQQGSFGTREDYDRDPEAFGRAATENWDRLYASLRERKTPEYLAALDAIRAEDRARGEAHRRESEARHRENDEISAKMQELLYPEFVEYLKTCPYELAKTLLAQHQASEDLGTRVLAQTDVVRQTPPGLPKAPEASDANSGVACPKCKAQNAYHAGQQGFGLGKAAAGVFLAGPVGLLGGLFGSKKVVLTCLKCGYKWSPE